MSETASPSRTAPYRLAVIMERVKLANRWATERWEAKGVVRDLTPPGSGPQVIVSDDRMTQVLFPGFLVQLQPDEAEGYLYNITSPHPKVGEDVRRAALKKLFSDPRFNVMDGLDVYIDDYSKTEPIPPEMMAGLRQAQNILRWAKEDTEERERKEKELQAAAQAKLEPPAAQATPGQATENAPDTVPATSGRSTDA